jgi:choloylglycine hydrolase
MFELDHPKFHYNWHMKKMISLILAMLFSLPTFACSIFMQPQTGMVAKNYDWSLVAGEVMVRPRAANKKSLHSNKSWTSLYGSVTFNHYGPDLPTGGMNEHGLMIEALILGETKYKTPTSAEKLELINESEFMQYQLDMHKSVSEVIASLKHLSLTKVHVPIHYFTCDQSKQCAVIEFIQGKTIVYTDDTLEIPVLTNLNYQTLIDGYRNDTHSSDGFVSHIRFRKLNDFALEGLSKMDMLKKLNSVKFNDLTAWQILYSPIDKMLDFVTKYSSKPVSVDLKKINFGCVAQLKIMSLEDKDVNFSHKQIKHRVNKRLDLLDQVPEQLINKLKNKVFQNECA